MGTADRLSTTVPGMGIPTRALICWLPSSYLPQLFHTCPPSKPSHFQAPSPSCHLGRAGQETPFCQVGPATERGEGGAGLGGGWGCSITGVPALAQGSAAMPQRGQGCRDPRAPGCQLVWVGSGSCATSGKSPLPGQSCFVNGDVETCFQGMRKRKELDRRYRVPGGMESLCQCGLGTPVIPGALPGEA